MNESEDKIIMYGTPTCHQVRPCRGILERAGADFEYVDISTDVAGRQVVEEINEGNASVPTLVFPDGSSLTEPSSEMLKEKLGAMGYRLRRPNPWESIKEQPFLIIAGMLALLFGFSDANNGFVIIGLLLLAFVIVSGWLRG